MRIIQNGRVVRVVYAVETWELTKRFSLPRALSALARHPFARREVLAVDRVTLRVREGELFGLLGPNGAGKTTLIKLLCTLIIPSSGGARIFGHDLRDGDRVRRTIGLSSGDERSFFWRLSGRENLLFFAALYGFPPAQARHRVEEVLRQLEITPWADQSFRTYSSGQRQRLGIARALLHRPKLLFLDEPTRSLDPAATRRLHDLILGDLRRKEGMTIVLTTHRLDEAEQLCDRVAIMHQGRIRACGAIDELRSALSPGLRYRLLASRLPEERTREWPRAWGDLRVRPAQGGRSEVILDAPSEDEALARLIEWVTGEGAHVYAVHEERPSLEEIFRRFTQEGKIDV